METREMFWFQFYPVIFYLFWDLNTGGFYKNKACLRLVSPGLELHPPIYTRPIVLLSGVCLLFFIVNVLSVLPAALPLYIMKYIEFLSQGLLNSNSRMLP